MNRNVSTIIPTFNSAQYLKDAIESVLQQSYPVKEIIVVNDGSKDKTSAVVEDFHRRYPKKVKYIFQHNRGPAAARNVGIKHSTGDYIAFLDADDVWEKDKLQRQMDALKDDPDAKIVYTDMKHVVNGKVINQSYLHERNDQYVSKGNVYENLLQQNFIFTPTVLVERGVFEKIGYFDETLKITEDYDLWLRIAREYSVAFVDQPLVVRHRTGHNLTDNKGLYIKSSIALRKKFMALDKKFPHRMKILKKKLQHDQFALAYHQFDQGEHAQARTQFWQTLFMKDYFLKSLFYIFLSLLPEIYIKKLRSLKQKKNASNALQDSRERLQLRDKSRNDKEALGKKVSVVIPAYNAQNHIAQAIRSVLDQTFPVEEILVVDDGSVDETKQKVYQIIETNDLETKIKYIYQNNQGPSAARNTGIKNATGDYIAFLDSDDQWLPQKIEKQVDYLDQSKTTGLVTTGRYRLYVDSNLKEEDCVGEQLTKESYKDLWEKNNFIITSAVLVRRKCFDTTGMFDEDRKLIGSEDWDMWLRIAREYEIAYINEPLVVYQVRSDGLSRSNVDRAYAGSFLVVEKNKEDLKSYYKNYHHILRQKRFRLYFNFGLSLLDIHKIKEAHLKFKEAFVCEPWNLKVLLYYLLTMLNPNFVLCLKRFKQKVSG